MPRCLGLRNANRTYAADRIDVGDAQVSNLALGLTLGLAFVLAGVIVALRSTRTHSNVAPNETVDGPPVTPRHLNQKGEVPDRRLPRRLLLSLAPLLPVPVVVLLLDVGRPAAAKREHTIWARGVRLVTDISGRPLRPADLEIGELVNAVPESLEQIAPSERLQAKAKAAIVLVRMGAGEITPTVGREDWHIDGIMAYSKICTHVGCPMGLYERTTKHLLCPCHQSTFDLADNGGVVFGPATRPLPQLPLAIDSDGFVVALSDFTEPVGPSYWERAT